MNGFGNFVLVPGILGTLLPGFDYFREVEEHLQRRFGIRVLTAKPDPTGSVRLRAAELRSQILSALGAGDQVEARPLLDSEQSYCQMLCMATSGGDPVFTDSVDELDTLDDVGKASVAL